eukprot:g23275.t1
MEPNQRLPEREVAIIARQLLIGLHRVHDALRPADSLEGALEDDSQMKRQGPAVFCRFFRTKMQMVLQMIKALTKQFKPEEQETCSVSLEVPISGQDREKEKLRRDEKNECGDQLSEDLYRNDNPGKLRTQFREDHVAVHDRLQEIDRVCPPAVETKPQELSDLCWDFVRRTLMAPFDALHSLPLLMNLASPKSPPFFTIHLTSPAFPLPSLRDPQSRKQSAMVGRRKESNFIPSMPPYPLITGGCSAGRGSRYNFNSASAAASILSDPQYLGYPLHVEPQWSKDFTPAAVFVGAMLGMLGMGRLGDTLGRTRAMQVTLSFTVLGAVIPALAFGSSGSIYGTVLLGRLLLGVGVGGIYPLSAVSSAEGCEDASEKGKHVAQDSGCSSLWVQHPLCWSWLPPFRRTTRRNLRRSSTAAGRGVGSIIR